MHRGQCLQKSSARFAQSPSPWLRGAQRRSMSANTRSVRCNGSSSQRGGSIRRFRRVRSRVWRSGEKFDVLTRALSFRLHVTAHRPGSDLSTGCRQIEPRAETGEIFWDGWGRPYYMFALSGEGKQSPQRLCTWSSEKYLYIAVCHRC